MNISMHLNKIRQIAIQITEILLTKRSIIYHVSVKRHDCKKKKKKKKTLNQNTVTRGTCDDFELREVGNKAIDRRYHPGTA